MDEAISLKTLFNALKKHLVLIMSLLIFSVIIVGVVSYNFLTPVYEASTQLLINEKNDKGSEVSAQDIQKNLQLIDTYNVIIKNPVILSKVIENLGLETTPEKLALQLKVNSEQNSQVVNVSVQDKESKRAVDIVNMTVQVFEKEIKLLLNIDNVKILSPAVYAKGEVPVKPNPIFNIVVAAVISLMVGIGCAFLLTYLDTTIKTAMDIEDLLEVPVLGHISTIPDKEAVESPLLIGQGRIRR